MGWAIMLKKCWSSGENTSLCKNLAWWAITPPNCQNWGVGASTGMGACLGQYGTCNTFQTRYTLQVYLLISTQPSSLSACMTKIHIYMYHSLAKKRSHTKQCQPPTFGPISCIQGPKCYKMDNTVHDKDLLEIVSCCKHY